MTSKIEVEVKADVKIEVSSGYGTSISTCIQNFKVLALTSTDTVQSPGIPWIYYITLLQKEFGLLKLVLNIFWGGNENNILQYHHNHLHLLVSYQDLNNLFKCCVKYLFNICLSKSFIIIIDNLVVWTEHSIRNARGKILIVGRLFATQIGQRKNMHHTDL